MMGNRIASTATWLCSGFSASDSDVLLSHSTADVEACVDELHIIEALSPRLLRQRGQSSYFLPRSPQLKDSSLQLNGRTGPGQVTDPWHERVIIVLTLTN